MGRFAPIVPAQKLDFREKNSHTNKQSIAHSRGRINSVLELRVGFSVSDGGKRCLETVPVAKYRLTSPYTPRIDSTRVVQGARKMKANTSSTKARIMVSAITVAANTSSPTVPPAEGIKLPHALRLFASNHAAQQKVVRIRCLWNRAPR